MPEPLVITEPGIYELENEEYHSVVAHSPLTGKLEPIISKSGLVKGSRSWAHYRASIDFPMSPTPAMQFGTDCHTCVLELGRWKKEKQLWFDTHIVKPAFKGTGSTERRKAWEVSNSGKEAVSFTAYDKQKAMFKEVESVRKSVFNLQEAHDLLYCGTPELSAFWFDEDLKIWMKCRPDLLSPNGHYIEFKTTTDTRMEKFRYIASDLKYHWHVFYLDILSKVTGFKHDQMTVVAAESKRPYWPNVFPIPQKALIAGRVQVGIMLKQYAECLKTDTWPGYPINEEPLKFTDRALWVSDEDWNDYYSEAGGVDVEEVLEED